MPDLSEMLGDVYGTDDNEEAPPAPATGPSTPEWADDEHLDRAFAQWTPGPDADAPAAERGMFAAAPAPAPSHLADDLAAALSEAVLAESGTEDDAEDESDEPQPVTTTTVAEAPEVERLTPSALTQLEPDPEPEPAPIPVPVHKAGWQRSDDDILPTGKTAKGGVRLPRPTRAGKAPKGPKAEGAPKKQRRSLKDLAKMEIGGSKKKK